MGVAILKQILFWAALASALNISTALAQSGHWGNKPGLLPGSQDAVYKDGPTEVSVSSEAANPHSGRALISFTEWGAAVSCQYGNDGVLMSDKGKSAPLVSMGCAPQGPQGATFMAQLSRDNLNVFRGASKLYFQQGKAQIPISTDGLKSAIELMR